MPSGWPSWPWSRSRAHAMTEAAVLRDRVRVVWEDVLRTTVTDDTNFFDLGGNSMAAMAICARLEDAVRVRPRLRVVFDHPRFADYVREISKIVQEER